MKIESVTPPAAPVMLQHVLDRLAGDCGLTETRRRDLRSAVTSFTKLVGRPAAEIPLDLGSIRTTLDGGLPAAAKVSVKRWANLRSDLAAAIEASGLHPMLKTANVAPSDDWSTLLEGVTDRRVQVGLSRFARWATLRQTPPQAVDATTIGAFIADLRASSLIRNIDDQHRSLAKTWNILVRLRPELRVVEAPNTISSPARLAWEELPASFREDVDRYLTWAAMPDPLDEGARARALAPKTRQLRRDHVHSAVSTAIAVGIAPANLTSLASVVEPETFKALLRRRWHDDGDKLSAYTHGVAGTVIAIAAEWVKAPAETITKLKQLRRKLGALPSGLTAKNQALLRKFDDPILVARLVDLPDQLWRRARRGLEASRRPFIDLQTALAIDILIHIPLRMENLSVLNFEKHLRWLQGRGKPAMIVFDSQDTKNRVKLEYEVPVALADRLLIYRNEIAPKVTGRRPDAVFVAWGGTPRGQAAISVAIEKAIARCLGVKLTPHQFRHIAAKISLDANPGAYELVRQILGHRTLKTTTNHYAGIDTRRAGRAHADLLLKLREATLRGSRRHRSSKEKER
jgi:integrase